MTIVKLVSEVAPPGCFALRPYLGNTPYAFAITRISDEDKFEERLRNHLEEFRHAPYFDRSDDDQTIKYSIERGTELAISAFAGLHEKLKRLSGNNWSIEIIGNESLFHQAWELMQLSTESRPIALDRPIVRRLAGTTAEAIPPQMRSMGRGRVLILTSRFDHRSERPPRLVASPISAVIFNSGKRFDFASLAPPDPTRLAELILPKYRWASFEFVHVDAHGMQLPFSTFANKNPALRAKFESELDLPHVEPYEGMKAFVYFDWGEDVIPVSGEQLAKIGKGLGARAIILNACRAGAVGSAGSLACDIVRAGIADVVAVRHNLTERGAELFATGFYSGLVAGQGIAKSVCTARSWMYQNRIRNANGEKVEIHDWLSVVHYSAASGGEKLKQNCFLVRERHPQLQEISRPRRAKSIEWAIFDGQKELARRSMKRQKRYAFIYFGALCVGAENSTQSLAGWLNESDLWWGPPIYLEAADIIGNTKWWQDGLPRLVAAHGENSFVVINNCDFVDDSNDTELQSLMGFLGFVEAVNIMTLLATSTRTLLKPALPFHATIIKIDPPEFDEIIKLSAEWILNGQSASPLRTALQCVAGHFGELGEIISHLPEERIEAALDYFVFGAISASSIDQRLADLEEAVVDRGMRRGLLNAAQAGQPDDPIAVPIAVLGSGLSVFDLERFDRSQGFPEDWSIGGAAKGPPERCTEYLECIEKFEAAGLGFFPHRQSQGSRSWPDAVFLNPILRSYFRDIMDEETLERLDRCALIYAEFKLQSLINTFNVVEHLGEMKSYFDVALPLFVGALWTARRRGWTAAALLALIQHARASGLWPERLDANFIVGSSDVKSGNVESNKLEEQATNSVHRDALLRAINQRDAGRLAEALGSAEEALAKASTEQARALAHQISGTIYAEQHNLQKADDHFRDAEIIIRRVGPRASLGEVVFERANVILGLSGDDESKRRDAKARYREALEIARTSGQHDLVCRCFFNMAHMELSPMPMGLNPEEHPLPLTLMLRQTEEYVDRAEEAARKAGAFAEREAMLLPLRIRVAAVKNQREEAFHLIEKGKQLASANALERRVLANLEAMLRRYWR